MISNLGIIVVVGVSALLAYITTRPASFRIQRTAYIDAPRDVVFAMLNDFREWTRWSPYEELDPNLKRTFAGPGAGAGAIYGWAGNNKAGEGRMTITESRPNELIALKLEFKRPFAATNVGFFALERAANGTKVSWIMEGKNGFVNKAFATFVDVDALVGKDFERGLAKLEAVASAAAAQRAIA